MPPTDRALLEKFIVDNEELDNLESKLAQFNIFEAIGVVRQEIRHSNFLAFLLNPSENHRLDDIFLKRFLKRVLLDTDEPTGANYSNISPVNIDIANLSDVEVRREWKNIDIFIHSPRNKLVCAIENKVGSKEHSQQLLRYRKIIEHEYSSYRKILIYLTPEGDLPYDKNWRVYKYSKVTEIIDSICTSCKSTLGTDVYSLMVHYSTLIRRHIVSDSDVAELCRKIYIKHKQALDLIFDHRPDIQSQIAENICELLKIESHRIFVEPPKKRFIDFVPIDWKKSNLPLLFHFDNSAEHLVLRLLITPAENNTSINFMRKNIYQMYTDNLRIFQNSNKKRKLSETWTTIYQEVILNKKDYESSEFEFLVKKVQDFWEQFIKGDFVKIENLINDNRDKLIN
ncbi:hypothetical protein BV372_03695 [Nostoc sp. T09]|uniref:PDDEXK-like family protein n=1 Tax=Nostoc sp. T09 TaxID=1932621 RepID=UPI000B63FCE6|nr:PD-(D/E)XK nuclease family protein [Nostoc sp. T09]OUL37172.1 hypothetical protein BV372_03695 [Nostoc sp. T09]